MKKALAAIKASSQSAWSMVTWLSTSTMRVLGGVTVLALWIGVAVFVGAPLGRVVYDYWAPVYEQAGKAPPPATRAGAKR